uniref:Uncharacterized protein n=1 Tax=Arundo donax TaxID=35708 RepID=A0A0A9BRK3_ARUDO
MLRGLEFSAFSKASI